jgi:PilZ domain
MRRDAAAPTRRFPRYELDRPLNVVVFWDDVAVRTIRGRCRVLGEGGLGANISDQLYIGDVVSLDLYPVAKAYGSVRNVSGTYHGFEFLFTDDNQRRAIKRLCDTCANDLRQRIQSKP